MGCGCRVGGLLPSLPLSASAAVPVKDGPTATTGVLRSSVRYAYTDGDTQRHTTTVSHPAVGTPWGLWGRVWWVLMQSDPVAVAVAVAGRSCIHGQPVNLRSLMKQLEVAECTVGAPSQSNVPQGSTPLGVGPIASFPHCTNTLVSPTSK